MRTTLLLALALSACTTHVTCPTPAAEVVTPPPCATPIPDASVDATGACATLPCALTGLEVWNDWTRACVPVGTCREFVCGATPHRLCR